MKHTALFALALQLLLLNGIRPGYAQKEPGDRTGRMALHNEVPEDQYKAAQTPVLTSAAYRSETTLFYTTQVNTDQNGENILHDAANEPSIAVDLNNPDRMAIGWRQFDNVSNNFRQAGYAYTSDGGETWTFPGVIDPGIFRSDPVLETDNQGVFYYNSLSTDGSSYYCRVYRSVDGGAEWDEGIPARGGDKQWMEIDKSGGIGEGNIYSFWTSYFSYCYPGSFTRSTDGGNYYEDCVTVDGDPYWGTMAIGPSGELYIVGSGYNDGLVVVRSDNAKDPDSYVWWEYYTQVDLDGYMLAGPEVNPAGLLGQASVAVNQAPGPGQGNVYVLASVERLSNNDPGDVMFAKSTDGGLSFSNPVRINDDLSLNNTQWFGTMSVAPNGRIDVVWLDTRDAPAFSPLWSSLYYSYSLDQGETWSSNEQLSEPFDPHLGWPNQEKMGDYFDMISDNESAHLAWSNTLNGEEDVYYGRITPVITVAENPDQPFRISGFRAIPNPCTQETRLNCHLAVDCHVKIELLDLTGRVLSLVYDENHTAGSFTVPLETKPEHKGLYICRMTAGNQSSSIRLVFL